jgi:hypothetical protein
VSSKLARCRAGGGAADTKRAASPAAGARSIPNGLIAAGEAASRSSSSAHGRVPCRWAFPTIDGSLLGRLPAEEEKAWRCSTRPPPVPAERQERQASAHAPPARSRQREQAPPRGREHPPCAQSARWASSAGLVRAHGTSPRPTTRYVAAFPVTGNSPPPLTRCAASFPVTGNEAREFASARARVPGEREEPQRVRMRVGHVPISGNKPLRRQTRAPDRPATA